MLNLTFNKRPSPCARGTDKHLHWVLCAHIFTNNMLFSIINSIYTVLFVIWYCPTSPETKSPWWSSSRFQRLHSLQVVKVDKLALKAEKRKLFHSHIGGRRYSDSLRRWQDFCRLMCTEHRPAANGRRPAMLPTGLMRWYVKEGLDMELACCFCACAVSSNHLILAAPLLYFVTVDNQS